MELLCDLMHARAADKATITTHCITLVTQNHVPVSVAAHRA